MTEMEAMLDQWRKTVHGASMTGEDPSGNDYKSNLLHEVWSPRWKWFQPPMWKIFRWAYRIKRTLYTGVYPVAIGGDFSMRSDMAGCLKVNQTAKGDNVTMVGVQFNATPYRHPEIEKIAAQRKADLNQQMSQYAKDHGIHLYGGAPDDKGEQ